MEEEQVKGDGVTGPRRREGGGGRGRWCLHHSMEGTSLSEKWRALVSEPLVSQVTDRKRVRYEGLACVCIQIQTCTHIHPHVCVYV